MRSILNFLTRRRAVAAAAILWLLGGLPAQAQNIGSLFHGALSAHHLAEEGRELEIARPSRIWPDGYEPTCLAPRSEVTASTIDEAMRVVAALPRAIEVDESESEKNRKLLPDLAPALPATGPIAPLIVRPEEGFDWRAALDQSLLFLLIEHTHRVLAEPQTRAHLGGPFFKEYWRTVRRLRGWDDGDSFKKNYIGHPMQGAVAGFIQVQNDPRGRRQEVGLTRRYFMSRIKAMGWSAAYSLQFELGPVLSEAAIGNIGMKPRRTSAHPMGFVDLVITPAVGTAWLVGEDLLDRYVVSRLERRSGSPTLQAIIRSVFNPTRSFANALRFKPPWHRDQRRLPGRYR